MVRYVYGKVLLSKLFVAVVRAACGLLANYLLQILKGVSLDIAK